LGTTGETRIQLCGRVAATIDGRRVEQQLPGPQGRVLFAYLVVNRLRPVARDELLDALWPGPLPAAADSALSALLSKLRRALGPERLEGRSEPRLRLPTDALVDLEAARAGVHRAEAAASREDWISVWIAARIALNTARRGFLPGHEAPWIDDVRRRVHVLHVQALEFVAHAGLGLGSHERASAERCGRALVELEPFRESGYRLLMEALAEQGNVAEALRVYESLRTLVREELGVGPGPETQAVHRRLLAAGAR
jgi:DNA-binding SARP family transcriptional activator